MIKRVLPWQQTSYHNMPEQGRAVVWLDRTGKEIHGCVSYRIRRYFDELETTHDWLPLRDDVCHRADVPIKYFPQVWRYVDGESYFPSDAERDSRPLFRSSEVMD